MFIVIQINQSNCPPPAPHPCAVVQWVQWLQWWNQASEGVRVPLRRMLITHSANPARLDHALSTYNNHNVILKIEVTTYENKFLTKKKLPFCDLFCIDSRLRQLIWNTLVLSKQVRLIGSNSSIYDMQEQAHELPWKGCKPTAKKKLGAGVFS